MMQRVSRILMTVASLLLLLAFVFPLWRISLDAPQYPEGLGLRIWINTITGEKPHDLENINGLNHYIGMQKIVPDSIPELVYMPYIVAVMILFGLLVVAFGKRKLLYSWVVVMILISLAGLADFYKWGYDYGHNLDTEHAAIKIPGMAYQPPVIGSKQILNFKAFSFPDVGGLAIVLSIGLGFAAIVIERREDKNQNG